MKRVVSIDEKRLGTYTGGVGVRSCRYMGTAI